MSDVFVLDPLNGAGAVRLGADREAVLAILGTPTNSYYKTPDAKHPTDSWSEGGLQVFYDGDQPTVAFVELSDNRSVEAVLFGLAVFDTPVPLLISEIKRRAKFDEDDPELGYSYIFPALELAFWRPANDDDEAPYFSTVGIGVSGYFSE